MSERVHPLTYLGSLLGAGVAVTFLVWLIYFKTPQGSEQSWVAWLPYLNAFLNSCSAYHLIRGWRAARTRQFGAHRGHMLSALLFSSLFLGSYIVYHSLHGDTRFPAHLGWIRALYLLILFTHIGLSVLVLPIILIAFALAFTEKFTVHPRFGRVALPIWLYVSVTGVIIVFFLKAFV